MKHPHIRIAAGTYLPLLLLLIPLKLPAQTGTNRAVAEESPVGAAPVWERDLEGLASGLPFLQAESVVVAIDQGVIRSYSRGGTHLWDFNPRSSVTPYVARSPEGTTYVCNTAGSLMAINRVGRELWRLELGRPITFPVVIGWDGRVFIPVGEELSCRTASGLTLWRQNLGSPMTFAPALDHAGGLVTVLENRDFLRVDQFGVTERIRLDRTPAMVVPLKSGERNSYFLIYVSGETEEIRLDPAANPGAKLSRSRRPTLPAAPAAAAGREDLVAVTLRDGRVLLLPGSGGQIRWTRDSHDTAAEKGPGTVNPQGMAMIFDERGIFVFSPRGATAFALAGRRRWLFRMPEASGVPALSDEGLLYACGKDRTLRTFKIDNQVR
ncbi:MAG: PQQ-binding-like beta-propeller repeat protein, partial [Spirochaetaceae bacterium]|nr:PQQ-binding-like beta-propeller repeat protein [Spirochaetaceae bacterium]